MREPVINLNEQMTRVRIKLSYIGRAFQLVWEAARVWVVLWAILLVAQGVLPALTIYATHEVVDSLVIVIEQDGGGEALQPALSWLALLASMLLLTAVLGRLMNLVRVLLSEQVQDHLTNLIQHKALTLDMAFYESPAERNRFYRANAEAKSQPLNLVTNVGTLIQHSLTLVMLLGILLSYGFWLTVLLVASALPSLYMAVRHTLREYQWRQETTPDQRRLHYYDLYLTHQHMAGEMRLFQLGGYFRQRYQNLRTRLRREHVRLLQRHLWGDLVAQVLALTTMGGVLFWMVLQLAQGRLSLGDLTLFYQTFSRGQGMMQSLLGSGNQLYRTSLFLDNLFIFLDAQPQIVAPESSAPPPTALQQELRFEQVTFFYPHSSEPALRNFDLVVPAGQIVAIVGTNGAGKSTFVKLLCRYFDPDECRITLDGVDLRQIAPGDLWPLITILFQQPVQYHETAAQNIAFGSLHTNPTPEQIEAAARAAGADVPINRLPDGYATVVSKWFGNTELSVGEWQRVALARAFLRQASIIVLDEPTSAMDSWAEAEWLARFRQLVADQTAIIITHRFTTAMQADIIYVMDEGRVVESGSHQELLAFNGRYAHSWQSQTEPERERAAR